MIGFRSLSKCKKDFACHTLELIINEPLRVPCWRLCRNRKEAGNIVIPAKAGIQCYQVLWGFQVKPGMTGGGII